MSVTNSATQGAPGEGAKLPAHETVYQQLRAQILFGELAPGQAVTIQGLTEALNAGMTPVREAIRRLISDGALVFQGNRRVSVPLLGSEDIDELGFVRKTIESELARRAALHITDDQIDRARDHRFGLGQGDFLPAMLRAIWCRITASTLACMPVQMRRSWRTLQIVSGCALARPCGWSAAALAPRAFRTAIRTSLRPCAKGNQKKLRWRWKKTWHRAWSR